MNLASRDPYVRFCAVRSPQDFLTCARLRSSPFRDLCASGSVATRIPTCAEGKGGTRPLLLLWLELVADAVARLEERVA